MAVFKAHNSFLSANGKILKVCSKVLFFTDFSNYQNYTSSNKKYVRDTPITGNPWTIECAEVENGVVKIQSQVQTDINRYTPSFNSTNKATFEFSINADTFSSYEYTYIWPHSAWGAMGIEVSNLSNNTIKITLVKSSVISHTIYLNNRIITNNSSTLRIGFNDYVLNKSNPFVNVKIQFDSGKYTVFFNDSKAAEIEVNLSSIMPRLSLYTQGLHCISKIGFIKISNG